MHDVLVIGAGPVGSQVAYRMARLGYDTAVIEQKADLGEPVCCTGIVSEECLGDFEITESVVYRHVSSARVFSPSFKQLYLHRTLPQAAVLNRQSFNVFMAGRSRDEGAEYFTGARVTNLKVTSDTVRVTADERGHTRDFEGKTAVIATGFHNDIGQRAGMGGPSDLVAGAQAEVESTVEEIEVYLGKEIATDLFAWLVPTTPGKALAGLLSRRAAPDRLRRLLSFLAEEGKISTAEVQITAGAVPLKAVDAGSSERLLLVGTAAGHVKPITGGGIYYGLLCADMAASTLHRAFRTRDFSGRSMARYDEAWKAKLGAELRVGRQARALYRMLSDGQTDRIFDIMQSRGAVETILQDPNVSFDWHGTAVRHLLRQRTLGKLLKAAKVVLPGSRPREKASQKETQL